jgi:hypothetical protein
MGYLTWVATGPVPPPRLSTIFHMSIFISGLSSPAGPVAFARHTQTPHAVPEFATVSGPGTLEI